MLLSKPEPEQEVQQTGAQYAGARRSTALVLHAHGVLSSPVCSSPFPDLPKSMPVGKGSFVSSSCLACPNPELMLLGPGCGAVRCPCCRLQASISRAGRLCVTGAVNRC